MPDYKIGTGDPPHPHDPGAGPWGSKPAEITKRAEKLEVQMHIGEFAALVGIDAARHMSHYLGNTGADLTIRLRNMVNEVPSAKKLYAEELDLAKAFVETLPDGTYNITSDSTGHGYDKKSENQNWFFATGGYTIWGKGLARVSTRGGTRYFALDFEYDFYDRYNWDSGKKVVLFGFTITDDFMGEFHRQGLAKEFDCVGSITDSYSWSALVPVAPSPPAVLKAPGTASKVYTVVAGDSLWKIARQSYSNATQGSVNKIYQANRMVIGSNPNRILPGQKLIIP
jgi:hypothetical protein